MYRYFFNPLERSLSIIPLIEQIVIAYLLFDNQEFAIVIALTDKLSESDEKAS